MITFNNNFNIGIGAPIDSKYLNSLNQPYASTGATNTAIVQSQRYSGLTVNILGTEYWYKNGTDDNNLISKTPSTISATNGLTISGTVNSGLSVSLGGALTGDTIIDVKCHNFTISGTVGGSPFIAITESTCTNGTLSLFGYANAKLCSNSCVDVITSGRLGLSFNCAGVVTDNNSISKSGLTYAADYSSTFVDNSLITKKFVQGFITGYTTGGTSSGERIVKSITQVSHGFAVNNVVGWSGGTYNKAIANGLYNGEVLGIVTKVNGNTFELTQAGYFSGLTTLSTNTTYFLSDVTAGLLTTTKPTTLTHIVRAVVVTTTPNAGWILPYAGYILTSGNTGGGGDKNNIYSKTTIAVSTILSTNSTYVILVNPVSGTTITLPTIPTDGQAFKIKDISGNAIVNNIIIDAGAGKEIDNAQTGTINTNFGALEIMYDVPTTKWYSLGFVN